MHSPIEKRAKGVNRQFTNKEINLGRDILVNKHRERLCPHISKMQNSHILLRNHYSHIILIKIKNANTQCGELVGN